MEPLGRTTPLRAPPNTSTIGTNKVGPLGRRSLQQLAGTTALPGVD